MKERPILFNSEMVRAILEGRKTQTRRVVKPQPGDFQRVVRSCDSPSGWGYARMISGVQNITCPYGQPGDRLWVRETFVIEHNYNLGDYDPPFQDGRPVKYHDAEIDTDPYWEQPHYRATDPTPEFYIVDDYDPGCSWKPSIHMPRWASRITLEITDVRVERVQDITDEGIMAEGFGYNQLREDGRMKNGFPIIDGFADLWDSINAKRGYSWDLNPWVWAISFKVKDK